ncbi:MAG TPA: hypothetical protein PKC45_04410 [Gemmatales bacterium]|nr:hypothetical protein [Gemmatales bacterium]
MPRKRKADKSSTDSTSSAANTTEAVPPTTILTNAATIEPVAPEILEQTPSFVERIEQERRNKRPAAPDPFGIAGDYVAGVHLFESRRDRVMAIKFDEKPSQEVLERVKLSGYRWNPNDKVWVHPIHPESARSTRIDAERLYQLVREMVREEKGIESGQEIPF